MLDVNLSTLAGGAVQQKFNRELTKVIENMKDPNTSYSASRSINIKLTFKQGEMRDDAHVDIAVTSKLAGVINASTSFALGQNLENGEVEVREYGKQIPGQMSIEDASPAQPTEATEAMVTKMPRRLKA